MKNLHKVLSALVPDNNQFKLKAYTLVELLITISIIAILVTIGFIVYSRILKDARDSKRQSDLKSIQSALEQYFADQFFYPSTITFGSSLTSSTGNPSPPSPVKTYINTVPIDPTTGATKPYAYEKFPGTCDNSTTNKCTTYCLYAQMENASNGKIGCTTYPGTYNFSVTLP